MTSAADLAGIARLRIIADAAILIDQQEGPIVGNVPTQKQIDTAQAVASAVSAYDIEVARVASATTLATSVLAAAILASSTPKIGGMQNSTAWTGGIPNVDYTKSESIGPATPYCCRFQDASKSLKTYPFLTVCKLTPKFKRSDPEFTLPAYTEEVSTHMIQSGMDSVFYFVDPCDPSKRLSVLQSHSRFTRDYVKSQVNLYRNPGSALSRSYDSFDLDNLAMSRVWILDSLDDKLKAAVRPQLTPSMSGPEIFMLIVSEIQSDSIRSMRKKERNLEQLALASFPGENVRQLNNIILTCCEELLHADCLPQDIILTIVEKYGKATSEEFRIHFLQRRSRVESYLREIAGKDPSVISKILDPVTFRTLVEESNDKYQGLLDAESWPPASKDKGAAPESAFMTKTDVEGLLAQAKLTATKGSGDVSKVVCYNCGEKGHYANKCTKAKQASPAGATGPPNWKKTPPATDSTHIKEVDGTVWYWCGICACWTHTHITDGHGNHDSKPPGLPAAKPTAPAPEANIGIVVDDSSSCGSIAVNYSAW